MKKIIKKGIAQILQVEPLNDPVETQRRKDICHSCEYYDAVNDQCTVCKCFIDLKAPMKYNHNPTRFGRVEQTHCPMGYWGDKDIANAYRKIDGKPLLE